MKKNMMNKNVEKNLISLIENVGYYGNENAEICFFGMEPAGYFINLGLNEDEFKSTYLPSNNGEEKFYEIRAGKEPAPLNKLWIKIKQNYYHDKYNKGTKDAILHDLLLKEYPEGLNESNYLEHDKEQKSYRLLNNSDKAIDPEIICRIEDLYIKSGLTSIASKLLQKMKGDNNLVSGVNSININYSPLPRPSTKDGISEVYGRFGLTDKYYTEQLRRYRSQSIRNYLRSMGRFLKRI